MIKNSKQSWEVGSTVKVGFLSLTVKAAIATPGDFAPDAYILVNAAGTQLYKFVPHNGVGKITPSEAQELLAEANRHAARLAQRAIENAKQAAGVAEFIGMVDVGGEQFAHYRGVSL
jgi:catalase